MEITDKVSKKETKELQNSKDNYEVKDLGKKKTAVGLKFGGKQYWYANFAFSKKDAKEKAQTIRSRGYSARVVKGPRRRGKQTWDIYKIDMKKHGTMKKKGRKRKKS